MVGGSRQTEQEIRVLKDSQSFYSVEKQKHSKECTWAGSGGAGGTGPWHRLAGAVWLGRLSRWSHAEERRLWLQHGRLYARQG